jgi:hypothetical protein
MIRKTRSSATGGQSDTTVLCRPLLATHLSSLADALFGDCESQRGTFERPPPGPITSAVKLCLAMHFLSVDRESFRLARKPREVTDSRLYQRRTAGQKRDNFRMDRGRRCKLCRHYLLNRKRRTRQNRRVSSGGSKSRRILGGHYTRGMIQYVNGTFLY